MDELRVITIDGVPDGWTPEEWIAECERSANAYEEEAKDLAIKIAAWRARAEAVREKRDDKATEARRGD